MTAKALVVPVEGIEPPLLAEHDFESCASTSSATRAGRMIRKIGIRFSDKILRQERPSLYNWTPAASMACQCFAMTAGVEQMFPSPRIAVGRVGEFHGGWG